MEKETNIYLGGTIILRSALSLRKDTSLGKDILSQSSDQAALFAQRYLISDNDSLIGLQLNCLNKKYPIV